MSRIGHALIFSAVLTAFAATPLAAQEGGHVKAGVLTCNTSASIGLIVGSHQKIACRYEPAHGGPPEHYYGHINRVGLDVGFKSGGVMIWAVIAPATGVPHGALAGHYVGGSGSASFGVGLGANVLVGGFHRSFALQPVSVQAQAGLNLAVGVAGLTLVAVE